MNAKSPPKGFLLDQDTGLLMTTAMKGRVVRRIQTRILETRATITLKGDFIRSAPTLMLSPKRA